jgi:AcrR family transcriptional regulator
MWLVVVALVVGGIAGVAAGGRFRHIDTHPVHWPWLLAAGVLLEVAAGHWDLPGGSWWALFTAEACLLVFAVRNLVLTGMGIVAVGLLANLTVIGTDRGMPVEPAALVTAGLSSAAALPAVRYGPSHHAEAAGDRLVALDDRLPIPPFHLVVSLGDIVLAAGIAAVVAHLLQARPRYADRARRWRPRQAAPAAGTPTAPAAASGGHRHRRLYAGVDLRGMSHMSTTVPPRRLPAADRRRQLLRVALDLFGSRGFRATSMEDIAEAAGVTKPVLYQHFPSKGELHLELIEAVGTELLETVTAGATAETLPYHRVLAGFSAYFRFVRERTSAFQLLFGGGAREDDGVAEAVRRVEGSIAATIADLIDVDLDQDHRDLLGFAIVGLAEVSSRQWVLRAEGTPVAASAPASAIAPATAAGRPPGATGDPPRPLDPAEGDLLARRLADLVWAGLRGLPSSDAGPPRG